MRDRLAYDELRNDALQLEVVGGCVTRFSRSGGALPFERLARVLATVLSSARFECAQQLSCARIQGPGTLATP